jgi:VWFA-related protein
VLNDAVLKAALDLAKRPKERRKVIFLISDGHEYRSEASYRDVLRVLLSNNIIVYAIDAGGSALPVFNTLSKLHVPRAGYSDILPKYVNATGGGEVFNVLTRTAIEDAYTMAMNQARNQYTLGYQMPASPPGGYRSIEVLVDRPSCRSSIRPCVNIFAKDGYYPVPRTK